ncbi:MAG: hypothetical protein K2Q01_06070, partial [Rickettsiales bacterium]|nr:hypothetical protein [Rickettsiales bacterium]
MISRKLIVAAILALIIGSMGWQAWRTRTVVTIAAFGDSLFSGYGLPQGRKESLPAKLEKKLKSDGY